MCYQLKTLITTSEFDLNVIQISLILFKIVLLSIQNKQNEVKQTLFITDISKERKEQTYSSATHLQRMLNFC